MTLKGETKVDRKFLSGMGDIDSFMLSLIAEDVGSIKNRG